MEEAKNQLHELEGKNMEGIYLPKQIGMPDIQKVSEVKLTPWYTKQREKLVLGKRIGKDVDFIPDAGIIIETPGFIPYYSGIKNLRLLASIQNKIKEPEIKKAMEMVGLNPDMKRMVKKYSLGMRQRLGLVWIKKGLWI